MLLLITVDRHFRHFRMRYLWTTELTEGIHYNYTVPQMFKLRPKRYIYFDPVKACEGVFLLCFLGQIVTWQFHSNLLD